MWEVLKRHTDSVSTTLPSLSKDELSVYLAYATPPDISSYGPMTKVFDFHRQNTETDKNTDMKSTTRWTGPTNRHEISTNLSATSVKVTLEIMGAKQEDGQTDKWLEKPRERQTQHWNQPATGNRLRRKQLAKSKTDRMTDRETTRQMDRIDLQCSTIL